MRAKHNGVTFDTNNWAKQLQKDYSKYSFDTGILEDKPENKPKYGETKQFAGITALQKGGKSDVMVSEVAKKFDEIYNWLIGAWSSKGRNRNNNEILKMLSEYARFLNKPDNKKRLENAVQAVVRNPILRGDYGENSNETAKKKGFNHLMIATGTFFENIKAALKRRGAK